jgi:hypothetical protein
MGDEHWVGTKPPRHQSVVNQLYPVIDAFLVHAKTIWVFGTFFNVLAVHPFGRPLCKIAGSVDAFPWRLHSAC